MKKFDFDNAPVINPHAATLDGFVLLLLLGFLAIEVADLFGYSLISFM